MEQKIDEKNLEWIIRISINLGKLEKKISDGGLFTSGRKNMEKFIHLLIIFKRNLAILGIDIQEISQFCKDHMTFSNKDAQAEFARMEHEVLEEIRNTTPDDIIFL